MERMVWTQTYDRDLHDVLALGSEAARAVAREIQIHLTPQEQGLLSCRQLIDREAFEAYLKGRYYWYKRGREGFEQSIEYFKEALEIDPAYALAWAGLADTYYEVSSEFLPPHEAMPKARAAAQRALAIDENLAEAHATLAHILAQYDWDWAAAERSYQRAIELNPELRPWPRVLQFLFGRAGPPRASNIRGRCRAPSGSLAANRPIYRMAVPFGAPSRSGDSRISESAGA